MILVDANLLLHAEDTLSEHREAVRGWWDERLSEAAPVCLCWPVLKAFIRIGTNPRLHQRPLTLKEACDLLLTWAGLDGATATNWPLFRGPNASGVSAEAVPATWNVASGENLR